MASLPELAGEPPPGGAGDFARSIGANPPAHNMAVGMIVRPLIPLRRRVAPVAFSRGKEPQNGRGDR